MDESGVKLEARLYALEYMVNHAMIVLYRSIGAPKEAILGNYILDSLGHRAYIGGRQGAFARQPGKEPEND